MLDWPSLGATATMCTILGYFLKKTDKKIDDMAEKLDQLEDKVVEKMSNICEERQEACSALQEEKVCGVRRTQSDFCSKLSRLEEQRKEDWRDQKQWNTRIEERLFQKGGTGR